MWYVTYCSLLMGLYRSLSFAYSLFRITADEEICEQDAKGRWFKKSHGISFEPARSFKFRNQYDARMQISFEFLFQDEWYAAVVIMSHPADPSIPPEQTITYRMNGSRKARDYITCEVLQTWRAEGWIVELGDAYSRHKESKPNLIFAIEYMEIL